MSNFHSFQQLLPNWGPYSKKYMGVSRIVDEDRKRGIRFDCVVHPTIANSNVPVPNVTVPSNYHPWTCNRALTHFSYRYDLEWKDTVYADVSFTKIADEAVLIRTEFINNSDMSQNCLLNIFSALEYPYPYHTEIQLPEKHCYIDAVNYQVYDYAVERPWDQENPDGMEKGVFLDPLFCGGKGLGDRVGNAHVHFLKLKPFGAEPGDRVKYEIPVAADYDHGVLLLRYRTVTEGEATFTCNSNPVTLPHSNALRFVEIELGELASGIYSVELLSQGGAGIELDCLAITEQKDCAQVQAVTEPYQYKPEILAAPIQNGFFATLTYHEQGQEYGILTHNPNTRFRDVNTGTLEDTLISRISNGDVTFDELTRTFTGSFSEKCSDPGFYHNTLIHSIYIPKGERHVEYVVVSKGGFVPLSATEYEAVYQAGKASLEPLQFNKAGRPYVLSNEILKATTLTNTVYPIYRHGEYIVHHTPGKRWDCLYTWDSGFIGLGLLEAEPKLAEYILDTYLSEPDNRDFAFLHHGSPVPVQFYQYVEMLKRANDKTELFTYYHRIKQYYDFIAGKTGGSTTSKFKSGLTTTYDYFYSSSGMDDYPAQHQMIAQGIEQYACPSISTSQVIRCAKLLRMVADQLGKREDVSVLEQDIACFTKALQTVAWDEDAGYFSYVLHNDEQEPIGFFRTPEGENMNKGMDGIYPFIAGACTEAQQSRLLGHIMNERHMLTPVGISAVDRSASYYRDNGYWNGNVWFSHQWFIWKTMLDLGKTDFAFKIADIALNVWKKEVEHSYYTFEMIHIETQRGGWFHHFGGLSTPVNIWANAYYKPGTLTTGLDTWVHRQNWNADYTELEAELRYYGTSSQYAVLAVLRDTYDYKVTVNGAALPFHQRADGTLELLLDGRTTDVVIRITRI